jgi:hypothetical protein
MRLVPALAFGAATLVLAAACSRSSDRRDGGPADAAPSSSAPAATPSTHAGDGASDAGPDAAIASGDAGLDGGAPDPDPMAGHYERLEDLVALVAVHDPVRWKKRKQRSAEDFLAATLGLSGPTRMNQGNKAIAHHAIAKAQCLEGLRDVVLQTDEQKAACGGLPFMVPIHKKGRKAKTCIDVFEFPNRPCELPIVWSSPVQAEMMCELEGKRLCTQEEWTLACRGDPDGGKDRAYAYGDELDLAVCNTNKPASKFPEMHCDADSAKSAWSTCGTNTEPAGAFPACRSRFGVYDQHGNVAEIMTRLDADGHVYDQLKGSAFFYADVARKQHEKPPKGRETYPDTCSYDPRWHVEPMESAWHVNYHLGFRCCRTVR